MNAHIQEVVDVPSSNLTEEINKKVNLPNPVCPVSRIEDIAPGTMSSGATQVLVGENCSFDNGNYNGSLMHFIQEYQGKLI